MNEKEIKSELEIKDPERERERVIKEIKELFNLVSEAREEFYLKIKEKNANEEIKKIGLDYIKKYKILFKTINYYSNYINYIGKQKQEGKEIEDGFEHIIQALSDYLMRMQNFHLFSLEELEERFNEAKELIKNF